MEPRHLLGQLLVVPMQVTDHRLQGPDNFAIKHHIHPEHAVRAGMLRTNRDFERLRRDLAAGIGGRGRNHFFASTAALGGMMPFAALARFKTSSCGVGSHS